MHHEIIGMLAAFLTTAAYVPQAVKVVRGKDTRGISLAMYSIMTIGMFFWLAYGVMINSPSIIIANSITIFLAAIILLMKIKHG